MKYRACVRHIPTVCERRFFPDAIRRADASAIPRRYQCQREILNERPWRLGNFRISRKHLNQTYGLLYQSIRRDMAEMVEPAWERKFDNRRFNFQRARATPMGRVVEGGKEKGQGKKYTHTHAHAHTKFSPALST